MELKRNILLTGAGFTANFGGFLGAGMWDRIFNHAELKPIEKIRQLLLSNHNFESIYAQVLIKNPGDYSDLEKAIFKKVVKDVYKRLDSISCNFLTNGVQGYGINYQIKPFLWLICRKQLE